MKIIDFEDMVRNSALQLKLMCFEQGSLQCVENSRFRFVYSRIYMKFRWRVQFYLLFLRCDKWFPPLPKFLDGIIWRLKSFWNAAWLGFLNTDDLNAITWAHYMGPAGFDAEDFNINQSLWPWEFAAVQEHFKNCKHVLIAGAGGGREVIALVRLGYEVTAFDFSSNLTEACQRNLKKAGCAAIVLDAPPDGLPAQLEVYDALLIGRGFYHHIPGTMRRIGFLSACRTKLKTGAPVLLSDFLTRETGSKFYLSTQTIANYFRRLRCSSERVELGDTLTDCMQHAFSFEEIEQELSTAGITLETCKVSPFSETSDLAHAFGRAN